MAIAPVAGIFASLGMWQLALQNFGSSGSVLPTPSAVITHIVSDPSYYWANGTQTALEASAGFLLALVIGTLAGSILARSPLIERMIQPFIVFIQVTPIIAYAGAVVVWFGFGWTTILFLVCIVCVVPIVLNTVTGLRAVDPALLELTHSVDASSWEIYWRLQLPSAVPYLIPATRIAVGLALVGTVLGELFSKVKMGLGYSIVQALDYRMTLQLWGSIFILAAIGSVGMGIITMTEHLLSRWSTNRFR